MLKQKVHDKAGHANIAILQPLTAAFNRAVQVKPRPEPLTGEAGGLIQRELMDLLWNIDWLSGHLDDCRDASWVPYPLAGGEVLASQPTLARPIENLSTDYNGAALRSAFTETRCVVSA